MARLDPLDYVPRLKVLKEKVGLRGKEATGPRIPAQCDRRSQKLLRIARCNASRRGKSAVMGTAWMNMIGPSDGEPCYYDAIREFESIDAMMCDVATYDDYFPDSPIVAQQQCGGGGGPVTLF